MTLTLNGKPFELNPPSPTVERIHQWLLKRSGDELYTVEELMRHVGVGRLSISKFMASKGGSSCSLRVGKMIHLGNPKAIAALKKLLAESGK